MIDRLTDFFANRIAGHPRGVFHAAAAPLLAIAGGAVVFTPCSAAFAAASLVTASEGSDKIILLNGEVIRGTITDETADVVRMTITIAGIEAPSAYSKSDILEIVRGDVGDGGGDDAAGIPAVDGPVLGTPGRRGDTPDVVPEDRETPIVYHLVLDGVTAQDIHPKPMRNAVEDARKYEPDYLIVELNNDWSNPFTGGEQRKDDDVDSFDTYSIVEDMEPIFRTEIEQTWRRQPEIVFWVKSARGGICLLPFVADTIYFHPDGRMGGIGTLEQMFAGQGAVVAQQKQRSLRLARAQGIAIAGGYDYRLVTAMARTSYVLSFRNSPGGIELLERMPRSPDEFLLTDNGRGDNADNMMQAIREESNDTLILRADTARTLGLSSGTATTLDDVLDELGVLRNHEFETGRGTRIMDQWSRSRLQAQRDFAKLSEEFGEVGARGNTAADARRALGQQKRILEDMKRILDRFENALDPADMVQLRGVNPDFLNPVNLQIQIEILSARIALIR